MANAAGKGKRMKVFQTKLGFYDTVVAASSQAAALHAWGVHQNLFASGQARITDDVQAVKAALANPETPLKRPVGSKDPLHWILRTSPWYQLRPKGKSRSLQSPDLPRSLKRPPIIQR